MATDSTVNEKQKRRKEKDEQSWMQLLQILQGNHIGNS